MKTTKNSGGPVLPQKNILGYGSELADALSRYQGSARKKDRRAILRDFAGWLAAFQAIQQHLCFADIYCRPDASTLISEAVSLLVTPGRNDRSLRGHFCYFEALKQFWGKEFHYAFAPHRIFANGLPIFTASDGSKTVFPETEDELKAFQGSADWKCRESCFLLEELTPVPAPEWKIRRDTQDVIAAAANGLVATGLGRVFRRFFSPAERLTDKTSNQSILRLWERWVKVFSQRTEQFRSNAGRPLVWLLTMPVGYYTDDKKEFVCFATLFVGFDGGLDREGVYDAMRYILLNLFESNAAAVARRTALENQKYLFAHDALGKVQTIRMDDAFAQLEQPTKDAFFQLQADVLLWNTSKLKPRDRSPQDGMPPPEIDLRKCSELARRLALQHLLSKLELERHLQQGYGAEEEERLRSLLRRKLNGTARALETFFSNEDKFGQRLEGRLFSAWSSVLEAVLVCGLRQSLTHAAITAERFACRHLQPARPFHRETFEKRKGGGLDFVIEGVCLSAFDTKKTAEWQIIDGFKRRTSGQNRVDFRWKIIRGSKPMRSLLVITDPTAEFI